MSYSTAGAKNFTMIDDLPDLDDLEGPQPHQRAITNGQIKTSRYMLPNGREDKYAKFIRQPHNAPTQAGMSFHNNLPGRPQGRPQLLENFSNGGHTHSHGHMHGHPHGHVHGHTHGHMHGHMHGHTHSPEQEQEQNEENNNVKRYNMPDNSPSCLDFAEHCANCPICSKFYNTDKTIYIIAIVVLLVICLILLKKVLER